MEQVEDFFSQLQPYAELVTPFKFEWANEQVNELSDNLGFASDQLRYMLCLFGVYPLAVLYTMLPSATLRHIYDIVVGLFLAHFVLGSQWVHSFLASSITYIIVKFGPPKYAPYVVFLFNITYISASHIYRLYVDYMGWTLDFTGPQMLLVIRLSSFAYNYYDGIKEKELEASGKINQLSPSASKLALARKKYAIYELPSVLEYFGYVYCFTTFLAGPAFEIREYLDVTSNRKFIRKGAKEPTRPSSAFASFSKFTVGIIFMGVYSAFVANYPVSNLHSLEVAALPIYRQLPMLYVTLFFCKAKYYAAWKIAEGATVLAGFGFQGFNEDGSSKGWNGVSNMDIVGFESATSIREASRAWNKGTQNWLERYVYTRTGNSLMATYFVSAFWHGFYPGYYLFFMSIILPTSVNRLAFKRIRPYFVDASGKFTSSERIYNTMSFIATIFSIHYFVMPFQAMSWENSIQSLRNTYFVGHILCVVLYIVFSLVPIPKSPKKIE